jgi:CheY-like chemotaxis protein
MLLYDSDDERNVAAAHYLNEGLKSGQLCVYASVGAYDSASKWHTSNISSMVVDYDENVEKGNLVIVDFKPFFESAEKGELAPFWQLRAQLEAMLEQRIAEGMGDKMIVFADAACTLSENKEFDECVALESWWQGTHREWMGSGQKITVICPHPSGMLDADSKGRIGAMHGLTLHLKHYKSGQRAEKSGRVLVAESDPDMQYLYRRYMGRAGLDVTIVDSGSSCLNCVFNGSDSGFDAIVVDAQFGDMSGLEIARKIKATLPEQKIIVTTTSLDCEKEAGVNMITKPFSLQKLADLIGSRAS